jgi:hypothetical protein
MTRPPRPRSPLAHGPNSECQSCRDCTSCDGGSGASPKTYRLEPGRLGGLVVICTRCAGTGTSCINLRADLEETTPAC